MKIKKTLLLLSMAIFLISCGGNSDTTTEDSSDIEEGTASSMEGMKEVSLSDYGIEASIYIPEDKGKADISETAYGSIEIKIGKNFGIEIVPFGLSLEEKKEELNGDLVYNIEYITEEADLIEFKKTIKDSDVDEEYHFFLTKEIDGEIYEVKSIAEEKFKKFALKSMVNSAKSLSTKNPA